ncbi:MAG: tetratricopeptide repeat protein [Candidatus Acidiferrales bacterium]
MHRGKKALFAVFLAAIVLSAAGVRGAAVFTGPGSAAPPDASAVIQTATRQFNSGNYSSAISTLQPAVAQNPNNAELYFWLARSYYELRDYDNAIANAEKTVQLEPKNSNYHLWLGRAYGGKADREHSFFLAKKVKKEFDDAVAANPSNISARRDLEEFNIDAPWIVGGSKDEAKAQVEAIAALDPVEGHLARAKYLMEAQKKPEAAEAEYRQVLAAKPNRLEPYFEVANFFEKQDKAADMKTAIDAAASVNANDPRLGFYRGVYGVLAGTDLGHAEQYLKSYLASTADRSDWPSHAAAREWLGRLYEAEGKRAEAAEQYRASLQLDPGRKEVRARLEHLEKRSK